MASSSAIRAQIAAKEKELKQLNETYITVNNFSGALNCLGGQYMGVGQALNDAVNIGGQPIDNERTYTMGKKLADLGANMEGTAKNISAKMSELEAEIAALNVELAAALAREAAEERARRIAASRTYKSYTPRRQR